MQRRRALVHASSHPPLRPLVRSLFVRGGGRSFSPVGLFAGGEQGAWYDPSDLSSMFQDTAGTTPAVVDSPVARINDKSGRGNHATQATSSSRPFLRQAGALLWLEFDGLDDNLQTGAFAFTTTATLAAANRLTTAATSTGNIFDSASGIRQIIGAASSTGTGAYRLYGGASITSAASTRDANDHVLLGNLANTSSTLELDKTQIAAGTTGTNAVTTGFVIGGDSALTQVMSGRFYGGVLLARALTAGEKTSLYTYLGAKAGLSL